MNFHLRLWDFRISAVALPMFPRLTVNNMKIYLIYWQEENSILTEWVMRRKENGEKEHTQMSLLPHEFHAVVTSLVRKPKTNHSKTTYLVRTRGWNRCSWRESLHSLWDASSKDKFFSKFCVSLATCFKRIVIKLDKFLWRNFFLDLKQTTSKRINIFLSIEIAPIVI